MFRQVQSETFQASDCPSSLHVLAQGTHFSQLDTPPTTWAVTPGWATLISGPNCWQQPPTWRACVYSAPLPVLLLLTHTTPCPLVKILQWVPIVPKIKTEILTQAHKACIAQCLDTVCLFSLTSHHSPLFSILGPSFSSMMCKAPPHRARAHTDEMLFRPERLLPSLSITSPEHLPLSPGLSLMPLINYFIELHLFPLERLF